MNTRTLISSLLLAAASSSALAQVTFTKITTGPLVTAASSGGAAWVDFDHDGDLDLFVCNFDGENQLYRNDGNGVFTKVIAGTIVNTGPGSYSPSWADFDNDGRIDLFIGRSPGPGLLFQQQPDGTFVQRALTTGSCFGAAWADYDKDGFLDLFVSVEGDPNFLYHNDGNSNAWITIKCVGTRSNRSAIGAKVRVKATIGGKTFWQLREINTGDGWAGVPLEAHFGLGQATNIETLRIEWPSGTMQEFQNVASKQYLTLTEPSRLLVSVMNGIPQLTLQGGRNFQYDIQTSTNLTAWSLLGALMITNLNGAASITDTNALGSVGRFYRAVLR